MASKKTPAKKSVGKTTTGDTKNRSARTVDMNDKLRALLEEMKASQRGASEWVFPSPQRGEKDIPGFYVPVDDSCLVSFIETLTDLYSYINNLFSG